MNRRQFLTGVSAAAVASALPAAPALSFGGVPIVFDAGLDRAAFMFFQSNPTDAGWVWKQLLERESFTDWRSFCATGEELG